MESIKGREVHEVAATEKIVKKKFKRYIIIRIMLPKDTRNL